MNKRLMILVIAGLLLLALSGASCAGDSSPDIVGKWKMDQNENLMESLVSVFFDFEFKKDGTLVVGYVIGNEKGHYSFPDKQHIKLDVSGDSQIFGFSLSRDTLVLTDDQGNSVNFRRITKIPENLQNSTGVLMATAENIRILEGFDSIPGAYDTSSPSHSILYWEYGKQLQVKNSKNNLYPSGVYTQTKDGNGNYPGECVSFVNAVSGTSNTWGKGQRVMDGNVMPGTAIATFSENNEKGFKSGEDHTAIFKSYLKNGKGFEVWDQNWYFRKIVMKHAIGESAVKTSNAEDYYVVEIK
jgi:hypothetical protein